MVELSHNAVRSEAGAPTGVAAEPRVLLRATNLNKSFGGQKVLNRVSLEVKAGEVILLKGDNGSGKTTLLNILTGCLEPDTGTIEYSVNVQRETLEFPRHWWQEANPWDRFLPERVVWAGICRTWQDARMFASQSLFDNIAVARANQKGEDPIKDLVRFFAVRKEEADNQSSADMLISTIGLESVKSESGSRVSFGHAKQIALARAARTGARILFLDEPLAGLDDAGAKNVVRTLTALARDEGLTLVIVEHVFNIPMIMGLATTVWTLAHGEIVSADADRESVGMVQDAALSELLNGISPERWHVEDIPLYGGGALRKATLDGSVPGRPVLEVKDLVVFRGNRMVVGKYLDGGRIEGLSFDVCAGELAFLYAANGWGKTTLMEAISGVLKPTRGSIKLNGKRLDGLPPWDVVRSGVTMVQSRNHYFASLSVDESLRLSGHMAVPENVAPLRWKKMGSLSGGEKRQVALANVGISSGSLCLLDEPFEGLDQSAYRRNLPILKPRREGGMLIALPSASSFSKDSLLKNEKQLVRS